MNRYMPHVFILPEDDCDRQLANGFVQHYQINTHRVQIVEPAGGWSEVLRTFEIEFIESLRRFPSGYLILLIDFDGAYPTRRPAFQAKIPTDLQNRVFVVGAKQTPELLKNALGQTYERIGYALAEDCENNSVTTWNHKHLQHNHPDRLRMLTEIKPILFGK